MFFILKCVWEHYSYTKKYLYFVEIDTNFVHMLDWWRQKSQNSYVCVFNINNEIIYADCFVFLIFYIS